MTTDHRHCLRSQRPLPPPQIATVTAANRRFSLSSLVFHEWRSKSQAVQGSKSPDDWECFLDYLGCLLEDDSSWCNGADTDPIHPSKSVDCKLTHLSDEVFDSRILIAPAFVQKLFAEANTDSTRCPYLANLEIERRNSCLEREMMTN
ncbi:hypothetical protein ACSBR1_011907 [Camellia fascicularis]